MNKVAVVYWSGTGNTQLMAQIVADASGGELLQCASFTPDMLDAYGAIAFGCTAMGDEQLEEDEFQPMWDAVKGSLSSKPIALFGSYNWADGEWMEKWQDEAKSLGLNLVADGVISYDDPDEACSEELRKIGTLLKEQ